MKNDSEEIEGWRDRINDEIEAATKDGFVVFVASDPTDSTREVLYIGNAYGDDVTDLIICDVTL